MAMAFHGNGSHVPNLDEIAFFLWPKQEVLIKRGPTVVHNRKANDEKRFLLIYVSANEISKEVIADDTTEKEAVSTDQNSEVIDISENSTVQEVAALSEGDVEKDLVVDNELKKKTEKLAKKIIDLPQKLTDDTLNNTSRN